MNNYRKGSMGEAEQKGLKTAKIVMGLATIVVALMTHWNLFHTNLYLWQEKSTGITDVLGIVLFAACLVVLFLEGAISNVAKNETLWYIVWIALLLAAIATSCGFNFSL